MFSRKLLMAVVVVLTLILAASLSYFFLPVNQSQDEGNLPETVNNVPPDIVNKGLAYFVGGTSFSGGGQRCVVCHSLNSMGFGGSGVAPDLSKVFLEPVFWGRFLINFEGDESKLRDFLKHPLTGEMKGIWELNPLTDDEVEALVELLKYAAIQG